MPNPNLLTRIYDAQQRIPLTKNLPKEPYITLSEGRILCCDTGRPM